MSEAEVPSTETVTSFHAALGQRITTDVDLSWRELAKQVATNDSTIRGWLKSTNPILAENLKKLLRGVGAQDVEVRTWLRSREIVADSTAPVVSMGSQAGAVSGSDGQGQSARHRRAWWRWLERVALAAGGVVLGFVLATVVERDTGIEAVSPTAPTQASVGNCGPVQLDLRSGSVLARVSHTGNIGVSLYRGPGGLVLSGAGRARRGYPGPGYTCCWTATPTTTVPVGCSASPTHH